MSQRRNGNYYTLIIQKLYISAFVWNSYYVPVLPTVSINAILISILKTSKVTMMGDETLHNGSWGAKLHPGTPRDCSNTYKHKAKIE